MALTQALFAGDDPTPQSVKRRRALAEALMAQGSDIRNVDSPLEAIGSILQSGVGAYQNRKADQEEKTIQGLRSSALMGLADSAFAGGGGGAFGGDMGAGFAGGGGGSIAPSGASANLKPAEREGYAMNYYVNKGLAPHQAAGLVGTLIQESSLNTGARNPGDGRDGSDSIGIMQANGDRARNLRAFAQGTGRDVGDLDTQLDFTLHEMGLGDPQWQKLPGYGSEATAGRALKGAGDLQSASAAAIGYERPAGWSAQNPMGGHGWANRYGHAQRLAGGNWGGSPAIAASGTPQPVQVASNDPAAGVAQATAPQPGLNVRSVVENAVEAQTAAPEFGAQDVAAIQARPKDPQAVPYSGPGATIDPRDVPPLAQGENVPIPTPRSSMAPQRVNAQGYAIDLPSPPPPPAQPVSAQALGNALTGGAQPSPLTSGVTREQVAQLLGNPATEDIGMQLLQQVVQGNERRQQMQHQMQLRRAETLDTRAYEDRVRQQGFARDDQIRQQGFQREDARRTEDFQREDQRNAYTDGRQIQRDNAADRQAEAGLVPTDVREYNFYVDQERAAGRQPVSYLDFQTAQRRAGATTITTGANGSKFIEKSDEAASKRLDDIIQNGYSAQEMLGNVQQLADLGSQIGTGKVAQVKAALGPYAQALGIDIGTMGDIEAYQSIIARMAPQMRPAGSGASSDFDARQFLQGLPALRNSPGGNEIITGTFSALARNKIDAADIASLATLPAEQGGITWQEAEKRIRALPNPYERFKAAQASQGGGSSSPPTPPPAPASPTDPNGQRYTPQGVPIGGGAQPAPQAPTAPVRARNPQTGEVMELQDGQWRMVR